MFAAICKRHRGSASTQRQAESRESLQPEDDVSEWRWELREGLVEGGGGSGRQSCGEYKMKT